MPSAIQCVEFGGAIESCSGTSPPSRHRLRRTFSPGLSMRPLRGRTEVGGGTAGRVRSLHSLPRPTAITFEGSAVIERLWRRSGIMRVDRAADRGDINQVRCLQRSTAGSKPSAIQCRFGAFNNPMQVRCLQRSNASNSGGAIYVNHWTNRDHARIRLFLDQDLGVALSMNSMHVLEARSHGATATPPPARLPTR